MTNSRSQPPSQTICLDSFSFKMSNWNDSFPTQVTHREVISYTSKLYDLLGWVAPILINFKILLQDQWIEGFEWDEPLNQYICDTWEAVRDNLNSLEGIKISR